MKIENAVHMNLNALRDEAGRIAREHGFNESTVGEDIALMHSELSEALEDFRRGHKPDEVWYLDKETGKTYDHLYPYESVPNHLPYKPCGIPSEIADVIIRALHFASKHRIDINKAVAEKMLYNETRPYKHGNKVL